MKLYFSFCLLILMISVSCQEKEVLLAEDKMIDIFVDLYIADEVILNYNIRERDTIRNLLTQTLLKIHNISQQELDTNIYLYQLDTEKMKRLTPLIKQRLEDMKGDKNIDNEE